MDKKITWNCRFHPFDYWHEVGCPHQDWSKEELLLALIDWKRQVSEFLEKELKK